MKNNVLKFGIISGLITSVFMVVSAVTMNGTLTYDQAEIVGYVGMLLAFTMIVVGMIKEKQALNGQISYGKALSVGLQITLIATVMYVVSWMVLTAIKPEIIDEMYAMMESGLREQDFSEADLKDQLKQMENFKSNYDSPIYKALITAVEIFPIGLAISLMGALFIKSRPSAASN